LSTFPIQLPALHQRADDIPLLAEALLARVAPLRKMHLSKRALARLNSYAFPGNVRELRNILERATLLSDNDVIDQVQIERSISTNTPINSAALSTQKSLHPTKSNLISASPIRSLKEVEDDELRTQLQNHIGSRAELAAKLGISERSLYRKLRTIYKAGQKNQGDC
jgi:DNA-binding NtrC family response regulator